MNQNYMDKKLRCGDVIDYAAEFFRGSLWPLVLMMLVFHVPAMFVINFLGGFSVFQSDIFSEFWYGDTDGMWVSLLMFYLGSLLSAAYIMTAYQGLAAAISIFTYEKVVNETALKVKDALKQGFKRMGHMILYSLLSYGISMGIMFAFSFLMFLLMLGMTGIEAIFISNGYSTIPTYAAVIYLILVGVILLAALFLILYFVVRFSLSTHIIAVEKCGAIGAMKRSFILTKKKFFRTLWPIMFGSCLVSLAQGAISGLSSLFVVGGNMASRFISAGVSAVASLLMPISLAITMIVYISYKKQEGDIAFEQRLFKEVRD